MLEKFRFGDPRLRGVPCAVAIGVFDGVHRGHRLVLEQTVALARKNGLKSMAVTFSRNPKSNGSGKLLASARIVDELLANIGIEYHCVIDFSYEMSKLSGVEFIRLLCSTCKVTMMLVGSDFRCGSPDVSLGAMEIGEALSRYEVDASVVVIPPLMDDEGRVISSSLIRSMLSKGDMAGSAASLGRSYCLDLRGVALMRHGADLLAKAGSLNELLPADGSYEATAVTEDGRPFDIELSVTGSCLAFQWSEPAKVDRILFKGVIE